MPENEAIIEVRGADAGFDGFVAINNVDRRSAGEPPTHLPDPTAPARALSLNLLTNSWGRAVVKYSFRPAT